MIFSPAFFRPLLAGKLDIRGSCERLELSGVCLRFAGTCESNYRNGGREVTCQSAALSECVASLPSRRFPFRSDLWRRARLQSCESEA